METSPKKWGFFVLFVKNAIKAEVIYRVIIIEF